MILVLKGRFSYMTKDNLGDRMKAYESVTNLKLIRRMPIVLRFDMCHGHTFTRGFQRPFDEIFMKSMQMTMEALCKEIQGVVFGYTQSDEITLVLVDYQTFETSAWFDNRLEKICSVGASMASRFFNKFFIDNVGLAMADLTNKDVDFSKYTRRFFTADFDCRAFNVPKEDVCNCVLWRQKDAERNSIQMLAQSLYSHKELMGISCKQLQNKMLIEKDVNWNNLPTACKRGTACKKNEEGKWYIDYDMPILTDNRAYVEDCVYVGE